MATNSRRRVTLVGIAGGLFIALLVTVQRPIELPARPVDASGPAVIVASGPASVGDEGAAGERLRPPSSEPTAETDAAWQLLRVRESDQVAALLAAPQNIAANRLFRSCTFNPRDQYLSPASRQDIAGVAERHRSAVEATTSEYRSVCTTEFERLHREGRTFPVPRGLDLARSLRRIGPDPIFVARDGIRFAVSLRALTGAEELRHRLAEQAIESCIALAEAFATAGVLTPAECTEIVERARGSDPVTSRPR